MPFNNVYIPYGAYWSTPFCRWQGSLSQENSIKLAANCTSRFLAERKIAPDAFDGLLLGITVPQMQSFYGAPWLAGMIGASGITGPIISQACATSARVLASAAQEIETGVRQCLLTVACDRTSNGPHVYHPNPSGTGGMGEAENPVWDNFNKDPHGGTSMLQTAENVAKAAGITKEQQAEMTLLRYSQYQDALADNRSFQRRYMFQVEIPKGKKEVKIIDADEGVFPTTVDGLAKLKPVLPEGTVTFGCQTFPSDGNAGLIVCNAQQAKTLARNPGISVKLIGMGETRVAKSHMPMAPVPAAMKALEHAGIGMKDVKVIKTHNPFAVNDIYFCRETGVAPDKMNRFGSPLIYGHPQGPTGMRVVIEMIEELSLAGGGYGLFTGCAAGDTAMAIVVKVS